eukprot:COSAG06_NODE_1291_length_9980_cov_166.860237_8_plen_78_part_00
MAANLRQPSSPQSNENAANPLASSPQSNENDDEEEAIPLLTAEFTPAQVTALTAELIGRHSAGMLSWRPLHEAFLHE